MVPKVQVSNVFSVSLWLCVRLLLPLLQELLIPQNVVFNFAKLCVLGGKLALIAYHENRDCHVALVLHVAPRNDPSSSYGLPSSPAAMT